MSAFRTQFVLSSLLILALAGTGCRSDPKRTGLSMHVSFGGLSIDQLEFTITSTKGTPVDHVHRPDAPAGPLADHQVIEIYLHDDLAGSGVTCDVVGLSAGNPMASDRQNAKVVVGLLVDVMINLGGAGKDSGADDGHPDGKTDVDAAGDSAPDADAGDEVVDSGDDGGGGKPLGIACTTADECDSGVCVNGVCCASTCSDCYACNISGKEGTCQPSIAGTKSSQCVNQGIPCGYNGTCDGRGACFRPMAGHMCSPAACQGSNLIPPAACDGQGNCQPPIPVGCAPFNCDTANLRCRSSCTGPADCVATAACTNNSCGQKPKKANGAGCLAGSECMSNVCADGVCCNVACGGGCQACNLMGQVGTCQRVARGKTDPHNVCKDMGVASCGTNGQCDGSGGCLRYAAGTVCEAPQCLAHAIVGAKTCDANGSCMPTVPTDCAPYRCNPATTMCFTSCMTNAQCAAAAGKACKNGVCR